MKIEKSCGAVVFTVINNSVKYIIIESKEGYYGFPKGRMEGSETETETALREIYEETGLKVNILDGFKAEDYHTFTHNEEFKMKHVVYFIAQYSNQLPVAQESELNSVHLMNFKEAISSFQFESSKRILCDADRFIKDRLQII